MFRHIVYTNNRYYIRKYHLSLGWKYWDHKNNEWYSSPYNGMEDFQSLREVWKVRRHKFVQFI